MDNKLTLAHPTLLTLQHIIHLGNGKGNPALLHNTAQHPTPSLLHSPAFLESAWWGREPSHVSTPAPRLTLPINFPTHHASTQQEKPENPVLTTTPRLPLSILRRTLRPHSEKGHKALYLQQFHVFCSQFSDATLCPHSEKAGKANQPGVSGSVIGNPALPP